MIDRPAMWKVVPEGKAPTARVEHFTISEESAKFESLRAAMHGDRYGVHAGRFARLVMGGGVMMSDTEMEWRTNLPAIRVAHGRVLVAGLGLGMVLVPMLANPEVTTVEVLEKSADVVALVEPALRKLPGARGKLLVHVADAFTWTPPKGVLYNVQWFDVWPSLCTDNLPEMAQLRRRYARRLNRANPRAWAGCWRQDDLRDLRRRTA